MNPGTTAATAASLSRVFRQLCGIMRKAAKGLDIKRDTPAELYVDTRHIQKNGRPLYFGGVQVRKNYVSYHLMPVYVNPALLKGISRELRARMQGKSCFNFAAVDRALFRELESLTRAGLMDYRRRGFVQARIPRWSACDSA